jgi:hypothetical protein
MVQNFKCGDTEKKCKNCEFKNLFLTFWEKNKAKNIIATETYAYVLCNRIACRNFCGDEVFVGQVTTVNLSVYQEFRWLKESWGWRGRRSPGSVVGALTRSQAG